MHGSFRWWMVPLVFLLSLVFLAGLFLRDLFPPSAAGPAVVLPDKAAEAVDELDEVTAFTRKLAGPLMDNATDAAKAELDEMHRRVLAWKSELPADEWKALHVIVMGSAMPRKDNRAVQYFARLLGEPGEGPRIIY